MGSESRKDRLLAATASLVLAAMLGAVTAWLVVGLLATQTDLWTTEARGFDAKRVMKRTYGVVDWPSK